MRSPSSAIGFPGHGLSGVRAMIAAAVILCALLQPVAIAQENPLNAAVNQPKAPAPTQEELRGIGSAVDPAVATANQIRGRSLMTDREQLLSFSILLFGLFVLIVQYLLLRTPKRNTFEILQLLTINLIVTGTLFLISAGFEAQQIAPGLGLFGTVAGYVLGRRTTTESNDSRPSENRDTS